MYSMKRNARQRKCVGCRKNVDVEDDRCRGCGVYVCVRCVCTFGHRLGGKHDRGNYGRGTPKSARATR